jgi:phosphoribosylaminoimidazole-succinocarboxamide synthase
VAAGNTPMTEAIPDAVFETRLAGLPRHSQGKVRDIYTVDAAHLLIVTTDRLSAFDVVLPDPIPGKGAILTRLARFWFEHTRRIVPNHLTTLTPDDVLADPAERRLVAGRAMVVRRYAPLPVEAVVRGYLIGSGYKDYLATGGVCGIPLPAGLPLAAPLPTPIFTPATKAAAGAHDENIPFSAMADLVGGEVAARVRDLSLALYAAGAAHAAARGIIIADTKFEFGLDAAGTIHLIDEVMTPDSSRFWPADGYRPGISPPSFDKQFVRDYLETLDWDKRAPGPHLPAEVIRRTGEKYATALKMLTGPPLG